MTDRRAPAGDTDYESTGQGYESLRRTDVRIEALVHAALGDARSIVNVGAGAGSYEPEDRYVVAVEPSAAMRTRRPPSRSAIDATAEHLPLDDSSVDAGLYELRRVAPV